MDALPARRLQSRGSVGLGPAAPRLPLLKDADTTLARAYPRRDER